MNCPRCNGVRKLNLINGATFECTVCDPQAPSCTCTYPASGCHCLRAVYFQNKAIAERTRHVCGMYCDDRCDRTDPSGNVPSPRYYEWRNVMEKEVLVDVVVQTTTRTRISLPESLIRVLVSEAIKRHKGIVVDPRDITFYASDNEVINLEAVVSKTETR